ncbi:MAG TPA: Crp/Fnr family transcriptional regulator [Fimbriimonas sp.]
MPHSIQKPIAETVAQSSTLLNSLTPEQLGRIITSSRVVEAKKGDYIWITGSTVDFFGLCYDGFIKMVRSCEDGIDMTAELMGPGQIFGMLGSIEGTGCPLSAIAVTDLWYLRIPKAVFLPIYQESAPLKDRLVRKLSVRLHGMVDLMSRMSGGTVEQRIAAILFILMESYARREGKTVRLDVPLTRQEISEMAGTTVESTIRTMSRWQKEGVIATERQNITILDEPRLSRLLAG